MSIINLLSNNGFIIVNKSIIKKIGLIPAVMLGELASEYNYFSERNELDEGMFYSTSQNIEDNTGLSYHMQSNALKELEAFGILTIVKKGIPCKRYIKFDFEALENLFLKSLNTRIEKNEKQEVEDFETNNNKENNNNNKNKKHKYGEFQNVLLTDEEYEKIKQRFPNWREKIETLSSGKQLKGYNYKSDYGAILKWHEREVERCASKYITKEQARKAIIDNNLDLTLTEFLERLLKMKGEIV